MIEGIVRRHGVLGKNESGERLLEMCAEQELVVGNSWFKKNDVYKNTWLRMAKGRVVDKPLMDDVLLPRRMLGRLFRCETVERRRGGLSDHFLVEARLKLVGGRRSAGRMEDLRNVLKVSELNNSVKGHTRRDSVENMKCGEVGRSRMWRRSGKSSEI